MDFKFFFAEGLGHITDLNGYDHILFVLALCAVYPLALWRRVVWLVTAFTLGHSLSLALAVGGWLRVSVAWVEFLIPVTIIATCLHNVLRPLPARGSGQLWGQYALVVFFGLIHGLGFSNFIRDMLMEEESLLGSLFAFNLGLEAGQLLIVAAALALNYLLLQIVRLPLLWWNRGLSAGIGIVALWLAYERLPF